MLGKGLYEKFGFGEAICEFWGLGPLGVRTGREAGVDVEGLGEGWREEWTEKGYQGASWWFMGRKAKA